MSTMMMTIMLQDMPVISVLFDNEYDGDDNYAAGYARPQCHLPPRQAHYRQSWPVAGGGW